MSGASAGIPWDEICAKIPTAKTGDERDQRVALFRQFDPNGNGYLSLAEVDKGIRDVLRIEELFDIKPVIIRAFNAAKNFADNSASGSRQSDYVQLKEFRMLLVYLLCYLRIWELFERADSGGSTDRRLTRAEFDTIVPEIQRRWLPGMTGDQLWNFCNTDGGSMVLFTEFAEACIPAVLERDNPDEQ